MQTISSHKTCLYNKCYGFYSLRSLVRGRAAKIFVLHIQEMHSLHFPTRDIFKQAYNVRNLLFAVQHNIVDFIDNFLLVTSLGRPEVSSLFLTVTNNTKTNMLLYAKNKLCKDNNLLKKIYDANKFRLSKGLLRNRFFR